MTVFHRLPAINERLKAKLMAEFHEPRKPFVPRVFHGPRPANPGNALYSDEQVLAMRRMREWLGMTARAIAEDTSVPQTYVEALCAYRVRAHLDPGPKPASEAA